MSIVLPKPAFESCDETSLKLKWSLISFAGIKSMGLQYKEVHEEWHQAKELPISLESTEGAHLTQADVIDLKPGTPYYVRLAAVGVDGKVTVGPETVFDTNPIDCTPKQRKCIIS
jgi:hypothetical protein